MANHLLFIFEGQETEEKIVRNLEKFFLSENTIICCAFCAEIYQLYKKLDQDPFLDLFVLLKELPRNSETLSAFNRDDFAEIYLFFDYGGHATQADDEKLRILIDFYSEETDNGKLYLSYPMVESLKHLGEGVDFKNLKVPSKENIHYKALASAECANEYDAMGRYSAETWNYLIREHLSKLNYIVHSNYVFPVDLIPQTELFIHQLDKYINIDGTVAVVSGFPPFLLDYYGSKSLNERLV